jgi:hypothetical protein
MKRTDIAIALYAGCLASVALASSGAAATSIRPSMQTVVTCVYDGVISKPGLLSVDVYTVGTEKYVIEYKFRDRGIVFTGGIGVHDGIMSDGKYFYTNETPSGQLDDHGLIELNFLGRTINEVMEKCHLMPGFDNTMKLPGYADPPWQKIDMPARANFGR